jgi:hypothetical protein
MKDLVGFVAAVENVTNAMEKDTLNLMYVIYAKEAANALIAKEQGK